MPASLMDMFGGNAPLQFSPRDYAGNQIGMGDAIAQNSNSLVGLGMGLLSPYRPGESPYAAALQGFQAGSVADSNRGYRTAQLQHQKTQDARQAAQDKLAASRWSQEFDLKKQQFEQSGWTPGEYTIPETSTEPARKLPYFRNARTGEITWPLGKPPGAGGGTAAAPSTADGGDYSAGAAVPFTGGGPLGTGAVGTFPEPTTSAGPAAPSPPISRPKLPPELENAPYSTKQEYWKKYAEEGAKKAAQQSTSSPAQEAAAKQSASNVLTALDTAEKLAANKGGFLPTTGLLGGALSKVYQPSRDLEATLDTVKANVSLDKLSAMRAASPSGASGLGAVTESEHKLLQASISALDQSQSAEQFAANLKRVRATYEWIVNRTDPNQPPPFSMQGGAPATSGGGTPPAAGGRTFIRDPSGKIVPQ